MKRKVYAYITHGERLLVFSHPDSPEAGIQVPGGTVEDGETPEEAAMREATEETGLTGLQMKALLGQVDRWIPELQQWHRRWFYHLTAADPLPERWHHAEATPSDVSPPDGSPSDGSQGPIRFEFFWARLPGGIPALSGDLGQMLPQLISALHFTEA